MPGWQSDARAALGQMTEWRTAVQRVWILGDDYLSFSFDTVIRESHTSELEVTDNPIETGSIVSDHAFMKPKRLEIEAAVGDVWLYGQDEVGNPVEDPFASNISRSAIAFNLLQDLQAAAEPFSVQTGLKLYTNMVVASLTADQDAETASILIFRASLREVLRVNTRAITYPPRKPGKPHRQASGKVNGGEAKGQPATEQQCIEGIMSCADNKTVARETWQDLKSFAESTLKAARGGG